MRIEPDVVSGATVKTADAGKFTIPTKSGSGLILAKPSADGKSIGKEIARIDERTGRIDLKDTAYSISVSPATDTEPMRLRVIAPDRSEVFSEYFVLAPDTRIEIVSSFDITSATGIALTFSSDQYSFYRNAPDAPFIPEGGYIAGSDRRAVAGVSRKGDIYILNPDFHLSYSSL